MLKSRTFFGNAKQKIVRSVLLCCWSRRKCDTSPALPEKDLAMAHNGSSFDVDDHDIEEVHMLPISTNRATTDGHHGGREPHVLPDPLSPMSPPSAKPPHHIVPLQAFGGPQPSSASSPASMSASPSAAMNARAPVVGGQRRPGAVGGGQRLSRVQDDFAGTYSVPPCMPTPFANVRVADGHDAKGPVEAYLFVPEVGSCRPSFCTA